jgi:hypothetical protein
MRRIRIQRRKVRRDRPSLAVLALDPRDPDTVRATHWTASPGSRWATLSARNRFLDP